MSSWIASNLPTIVVSLILMGVVTAIIMKMARDRKKGRSSCGCGCAHCAMSEACHKR